MKRVLMTASALALGAVAAHAGGVERSSQSVGILFEKGNYAELSFGAFNPSITGSVGGGAVSSGDMAPGYGTFSLGIKKEINDQVDMAVIVDQPIGAKVSYPAGTGYPLAGSTASVDSLAVTGLLRYSLPSNVSLIGGLRVERVSGEVALPAYGYTMSTDTDTRVGYVLGVAWEKPEIAARVALTYNSAMKHTLHSSESFAAGPLAGNYTTAFQTEVPQSVNLEFQTGVAVDTLVFGSVRWVNWEAFDITPPMFNMAAGPLVSYNHDTTTFNLGVGRKFNESWSAAVQAGYEKHHTTPTGNLGPHDGMKSLGVAATYSTGAMKITGGLRYVEIGDAVTRPPVGGVFTDNSGWGAGLRVGFSF